MGLAPEINVMYVCICMYVFHVAPPLERVAQKTVSDLKFTLRTDVIT